MPTKPECFVVNFDLQKADKLKQILIDQGFAIEKPPYTHFAGKKKGVSCVLYTSGKLTVQGKESKEFIEFILEPEILEKFHYGYETLSQNLNPHIGIDESGKGDFFGPLCVAGVYADKNGIEKLKELNVKDSKRLSDAAILKIAKDVRKNYVYHVLRIGPKKYNELYTKFGNLNLLLGWGHALIAGTLVEKSHCTKVMIDQFAAEHVALQAMRKRNEQIELTQRPRGEEDLVVAAASILARAEFLQGMEALEIEFGVKLPKGASDLVVQAGKEFAKRHGKEGLGHVAKLHFRTIEKILEEAN